MLKSQAKVTYPSEPVHNASVVPLLKKLKTKGMKANLERFTSFYTRYYKSDYGAQSSRWLRGRVNDTLAEAGALKYGARVEPFPHPWGQDSIIATLPGKTNKTIVIGAHQVGRSCTAKVMSDADHPSQDSINLFFPSLLAAPGADDDGSGTVTILEALRVLLMDEDIVSGKHENTIEFHWYSAEEGGLLGSQAIFSSYEKEGRDVKAMSQTDMTGFIKGTIAAGKPESVGVITDFVDPGLTEFIKMIITSYCDIPYVLTKW